jgi:ketosteroid isomerase-like protein
VTELANNNDISDVIATANALIAAFGRHDTEAYFAHFADNATMVFHNTANVMTSRAAYEAEWATWEADGFVVHSCSTHDQQVTMHADVAVFTHRVQTKLTDADGDHDARERETIVFARQHDGRWLVVHEHLSLDLFAEEGETIGETVAGAA